VGTFSDGVFWVPLAGLTDPELLASEVAQTVGAPSLGAWWWVAGPASFLLAVVLAFTLVGNALDAILNPRGQGRR